MDSGPALFRAVPDARDRIGHVALTSGPTRVHRVTGLLPRGVELWVKRDDETSSSYGGNKVRKLEFLLGQARARRARRLVTFGGWGGHHPMATAVHGRALGFEVDLVMFPQPVDAHVRELVLAEQALGARLVPVSSMLGVLPEKLRALRDPDAAWLPGGGSNVLGTLGYASAGFEIMEQVRDGVMPRPDVVWAAHGSGGTVAGLLVGLRDPARAIEVVGVGTVAPWMYRERALRRMAREAEALSYGKRSPPGMAPVFRPVEEFGKHFGLPTRESEDAVKAAESCGLALEPIYTGKVMAALIADARAGRLDGRRVLFIHTHSATDLRPLAARAPGPRCLPEPLRRLFPDAATDARASSPSP